MHQFDVFPNPSQRSRAIAPFVVVLQSHFLEAVPTTIVAPLLIDDGRSAYSGASVRLTFRNQALVLSVPELAGIEPTRLKGLVGSVAEHEYEIRRAIDRIFTGF